MSLISGIPSLALFDFQFVRQPALERERLASF